MSGTELSSEELSAMTDSADPCDEESSVTDVFGLLSADTLLSVSASSFFSEEAQPHSGTMHNRTDKKSVIVRFDVFIIISLTFFLIKKY